MWLTLGQAEILRDQWQQTLLLSTSGKACLLLTTYKAVDKGGIKNKKSSLVSLKATFTSKDSFGSEFKADSQQRSVQVGSTPLRKNLIWRDEGVGK